MKTQKTFPATNTQDAQVFEKVCDSAKSALPVKVYFDAKQLLVPAICCLLLLCGCRKDPVEEPVSDSIFGEYYYSPPSTGSFWGDLLGGSKIEVFRGNATYIKIIDYSHSRFTAGALVFDSVKMLTPTSFTINQFIRDQQSASGFSIATGLGSFGKKLVSYNILIERNGTIGNSTIVITNAVKTRY